MSAPDDLDRLRQGLGQGAPAPDPAARARALSLALESFDTHQALGRTARHGRNRPAGAGFLAGVRKMLDRLTSRAALGATASLAVLAIGGWLVTGPRAPVTPPPGAEQAPALETAIATVPEAKQLAPQPEAPARLVAPAAPAAPMTAQDAATQGAMAPARAQPQPSPMPATGDAAGDRFAQFDPNPLKVTAEAPVSTFSVDVDTASWSWVRGALNLGQMPDPASVRLEEMVNYFSYDYPAPEAGAAPFRPSVAVFPTPWNPGTRLVRIGLQGRLMPAEARPPVNLVFLIDTSGSMQGPDRLGLLKYAFRQLLGQLRDTDKVAIVAYAGSAGEVLPPTPATDRAAIVAALDGLNAGGSTAGGAGLDLAYRLAERMGGKGSVNRVVLATDGDFNVGLSDPDALAGYVAEKRQTGVYLSVLGFGRGNLDDAVMQSLAQNGNGTAAYIDNASEARKVLADQAGGALFPIAGDVKVQVEWNPAVVAEYRLLGYETRALAREDFADDKVDAGDIGAGHQVTALYEITPVGSPARLTDPLRYAPAPTGGPVAEAGWLRLRYKAPGETVSALIEAPIPAQDTEADEDARFAAAIAGFAQLLTGGRYLRDWGWDQAVTLAEGARGADPFGYRAEAARLMRAAQGIAAR
jgi:Ca-activated chloride channel homolog